MRRLSGLMLGFGLVLIVFCLSLGLVNADWTINQAKGYMNTTDRIAIGYFEPAPNANLDVANWSRMQGIRVHTLIVDGNVGIGTTAPQSKLHIDFTSNSVVPTLLLSGTSNLNYTPRAVFVDTKLGSITKAPAWGVDNWEDKFRIWRQPNITTHGNTYLTILNNGNVGIGTTSPGAKLHVVADSDPIANEPDRYTQLQIHGTTGEDKLFIGIDTTDKYAGIAYVQERVKWGPLVLQAKGGNVGIGTTSPREKLHVNGTIRIEGWDAVLHSVDTAGRYQDLIGTYQGWNPNTVYIAGYNAVNSGRNTTAVSIGGYGSERLWVNLTSGKVGIGTTNPGAKLHLSSLGSTNDGIIIDNPDSGSSKARIFFREGGSASYGGIVGYDAGADILYLNTLENTVEKQGIAIARSTGYVGIGTTTPAYKLDVSGDIRATGAVRSNVGTPIYKISNSYCEGYGFLTNLDTCNTSACVWDEYGYPTWYYTCGGKCEQGKTHSCPNTLLGRLLSSY